MQITMGLPEPREFPRICLVQSGIQRIHSRQTTAKVRLPITPTILCRLKEHWSPQRINRDVIMIWAAATLCFFRSGEITVPTENGFEHSRHLAWGDRAIDSTEDPQSLKVHLRRSKSDQLGNGVDVYIGKTDCPLCPVVATMQYMAQHKAPSFYFKTVTPSLKHYSPIK